MKCSVSTIAYLTALVLADTALGATYSISDNIVGNGFNSAFTYQAIADPTNGRVNYVDQATAQADNLTYASGDTFILRADYTTTLSASGPGRNSVRLQSNAQYSTHVAVFDIRHMPQGCGTWPAVWEVGADWPDQGETDILEGVNDVPPDQVTLHTSSGCTMPDSRDMTGTSEGTDCSTADTNNAGCGVQSTDTNSYGPDFNNNGGGLYAIERTDTFIKVWFWPRNSGSVPGDVNSGTSSVDTDNWGTPMALFPDADCDFSSHFGPHNIIINLTFSLTVVLEHALTLSTIIPQHSPMLTSTLLESGSTHRKRARGAMNHIQVSYLRYPYAGQLSLPCITILMTSSTNIISSCCWCCIIAMNIWHLLLTRS